MGREEVPKHLFIIQPVGLWSKGSEDPFWYLGTVIFCSDLGTISSWTLLPNALSWQILYVHHSKKAAVLLLLKMARLLGICFYWNNIDILALYPLSNANYIDTHDTVLSTESSVNIRYCLIIACYCALLRMSSGANLIQNIQNNVKNNSLLSC